MRIDLCIMRPERLRALGLAFALAANGCETIPDGEACNSDDDCGNGDACAAGECGPDDADIDAVFADAADDRDAGAGPTDAGESDVLLQDGGDESDVGDADAAHPDGEQADAVHRDTDAGESRPDAEDIRAWDAPVLADVSLDPRLDAPREVSASDGQFADRVVVTWEPVDGATGYRVYRDGMGLDDIESVTLDDLGVDTGAVPRVSGLVASTDMPEIVALAWESPANPVRGRSHAFSVAALYGSAISPPSESDDGFAGADVVAGFEVDTPAGLVTVSEPRLDDTTAARPAIELERLEAELDDATVRLRAVGVTAIRGASHAYRVRAVTGAGRSGEWSDAATGHRVPGPLAFSWEQSAFDIDRDYLEIAASATDTSELFDTHRQGESRYYRVIVRAQGAMDATSSAVRLHRAGTPWIVYVLATTPARLAVVRADGRSATILDVEADYLESPQWSPDGHRLAYVANELGDGSYIRIIDFRAGSTVNVPHGLGFVRSLTWSPDGSSLVIAGSMPGAETRLWRLDVGGDADAVPLRDRHLVTWWDRRPVWAWAADRVFFTRDTGPTNQVYAIDPSSTVSASQLTSNEGGVSDGIAVTSLGDVLYYVAGNPPRLWRQPADQPASPLGEPWDAEPDVVPGDAYIVVSRSFGDDVAELVLLDATSGELVRRLTFDDAANLYPDAAPTDASYVDVSAFAR